MDLYKFETIACSYGAPVGLDWEYIEYESLDLDEYENNRGKRRTLRALILNYYQRCDILENAGYTKSAIARATRAINKDKRQRNMTQFFAPVDKVQELVTAAVRS